MLVITRWSKYGCLNGGVKRVFSENHGMLKSPSKGQLKMGGFTSIFGNFPVENDDKLVDFRDARNSTHNFMPFHQNLFLTYIVRLK